MKKTVHFIFSNKVSTVTGQFTFDTEKDALEFYLKLKEDPRYVEVVLKY